MSTVTPRPLNLVRSRSRQSQNTSNFHVDDDFEEDDEYHSVDNEPEDDDIQFDDGELEYS